MQRTASVVSTVRALRTSTLLAAVAVAAAAWVVEPVLAQDAPRGGQGQGQGQGGGGGGGRGGMGGMFRGMGRGMGVQNQFREAFEPDFVRRDLPLFKQQLTLEDPQMVIVEQLLRDYEDAFDPAREEMMEQMQAIGQQMMAPMMNPEMQERWRSTMQKAREQMEQMAAEKGTELTPEERQAFFREQMSRMGEEVRAEMKTNGAFDQMRASMGEMVADFNKWQATKGRLRDAFVAGMEASLSETQQKKWPSFQRFLAREKTLPRSTISGEGVNLFFVLDEAGLSAETFAQLQGIMDEYELQLDAALKARNDFLASNEIKYLESMQTGDSEAARRFAKRAMDLRQAVREVNDRYRDAICAQLPEADAGRVRAAALSAGFERVYAPSRVQRAMDAALGLEGLDASVQEAIRGLQAQYVNDVSPLNDRIALEMRREEPDRQVEDMVRVVGFMTGDVPMSQMFRGRGNDSDSPSAKLMDKRGELNDDYMKRLESLLTPEQREQLPRGGGGGGRGGMGGMFGGGGPITLADMPEQARERMKEFDKNNDGTIDDNERQAMIEAFRERGGGFGGGGGGGGGGGRGGRGGQQQN
jgi:hypothetical protein